MKLQQMILANVSLGAFGIILSMIPVIYLIHGKRYRQQINRYFFGIAISNICMIIGALVNWLLQQPVQPWQKIVHLVFAELYYISSTFILYFFAHYIITYARIEGKPRKFCLLSVTALCIIQIFFAIGKNFRFIHHLVRYIFPSSFYLLNLFITSPFAPQSASLCK